MPLADQDEYRTPADCQRSWLARVCPWPRISFYVPVLRIVWRSSGLAKRGQLDGQAWAEACLAVIRSMEGVGMRLTIEGMQHLREPAGPVVFVANHMSTLETFVLPAIIRPVRPVTFVVKDSLIRYPVFAPIMRSRDPIVVGRANPREDLMAVLKGGRDRLDRGVSIVVFPQTTRTNRFDPTRFNTIGVKLAARSGVPVVPLAVKTDAWGTGRWLKDFGPVRPALPVHFRFAAPIQPQGKGNEAHEATVRFIQGALAEWTKEEA